ncbi:alpha/beta-hydrolase [Calocera cornea HHB12733]|uniref:Alpha/beta-hydrolase n=1 Tax=Calocera cornea HHB12733 TaxID=1353952 RepID=A0A165DQA1_9BASI|nr:alpha/beta-hydrolase [Calocera cornea HHB12733]
MMTLDVPGASLFYETHGSGPLFVIVPGGGGSGDSFHPLATVLAAKYTVVTYDRRGFSKSALTGQQDYSVRLQTDVDDVHALIKHLSPDGTAVVFGSSSGAIIAISTLLTYPTAIRALIPHEPPLCALLPDGDEWIKWNYSVYDVYKAEGTSAAFEKFMDQMSGGMELKTYKQRLASLTDEQKKAAAEGPMGKNQAYWFEHELRQYPAAPVDLDALAKLKDKLILVAGEDSEELFPFWPIRNLSEKLDLPITTMPGAHVGFMYAPEPCGKIIMEALEKKGNSH